MSKQSGDSSSSSFPVLALTALGIITVLGLFAAGDMTMSSSAWLQSSVRG